MVSKLIPFHGEFASADARALSEAVARFLLYEQGGVTAITLASTEYVHVYGIAIGTTTSGLYRIYDGADNTVDAGELILGWGSGIGNGVFAKVDYICQQGTYPKCIASVSGQIYASIYGVIRGS